MDLGPRRSNSPSHRVHGGQRYGSRIAQLRLHVQFSLPFREVLRNLTLKTASLGFEKVSRLVVVVASARALGQAAFGRFVFASTVTALLAFGTDLGLGVWTTRELARRRL